MAIEVKNLCFAYPGSPVTAVENVSFTIGKGERVAIIGQNGAGKSTTVKIIDNIYKPTSGTILVDGIDTKDKTTADPQPTLNDVKEKFGQALEQDSNEEIVIHEFCNRMQIPFEKISSEDFSAFLRILSLSKMLKNPNNMRGKAKPQPYYAPKRKKRR